MERQRPAMDTVLQTMRDRDSTMDSETNRKPFPRFMRGIGRAAMEAGTSDLSGTEPESEPGNATDF